MTYNADELVDLVDENDSVVRVQWRSKIHEYPDLYARAVLAFLVNEQGQLCFLRRAPHKAYLPNHWALIGGGVQSGESYEQAMIRETTEEANIVVHPNAMRFLGHVTPTDYPGKYFKAVYEIKVDDMRIPYNPEDFCQIQWMAPNQLCDVAQRNTDLLAHDLLFLTKRFYS